MLYFLVKKTKASKLLEFHGERIQKRVWKSIITFYCVFFVISIFLIIRNQIDHPRSVKYITSVFESEQDISLLFKILSYILITFQIIITLFLPCLFEVLVVGFAAFVQHGLAVLADNRISKDDDTTDIFKNNRIFEINMNRYEDLNILVNQFNQYFSNLIILYKGFALLHIYFFVFCFIRYRNHPELHLFFFIAVLHVIRILFLLPYLAAVYKKSLHFKAAWSKALKCLTELQQDQIALIQPLGIKPGNLYVVLPSTLLTFFSVMTTHIIVLLQILGVK